MFERYTEKARRTIFFARYEAARHGAAEIGTASLLLGILREDKVLMTRLLPDGSAELVRLSAEVDALIPATGQEISASVDIPVGHAARRALTYAAEESERSDHKYIDPRHLLLGVLREEGSETARLRAHGVDLEKVRADLRQDPPPSKSDAGYMPGWASGRVELVRALREMPPDRRDAAAALLVGLASGKFEASGTSGNGRFHFSFEDETD